MIDLLTPPHANVSTSGIPNSGNTFLTNHEKSWTDFRLSATLCDRSPASITLNGRRIKTNIGYYITQFSRQLITDLAMNWFLLIFQVLKLTRVLIFGELGMQIVIFVKNVQLPPGNYFSFKCAKRNWKLHQESATYSCSQRNSRLCNLPGYVIFVKCLVKAPNPDQKNQLLDRCEIAANCHIQ